LVLLISKLIPIDADEKRLYYMPPNTPFLDEPEKLKSYRQGLLKQISTIPQPEPVILMAHELQKQAVMDLDDRSQPETATEDLKDYFKRRENQLQHQKYRILHRWAHYALSSEK
jgi:hypothetical protein